MFQWVKIYDIWTVAEVAPDCLWLAGMREPQSFDDVQEWGDKVIRTIYVEKKQVIQSEIKHEPTPSLDVAVAAEDEVDVIIGSKQPYFVKDHKLVESQRNADCGVVAIANVLNIPYKQARLIAFQHGWSSLSGISCGWVEAVMLKHGFEINYRVDLSRGIVKNFAATGTFLVHCTGHVMPYVYKLLNIQSCALYPITEVWEVNKISLDK